MTYADRVAQAVKDPEWQKLRVSLKGMATQDKIARLYHYWTQGHEGASIEGREFSELCVYCVRVDNYIKALCRGGQLFPGTSLEKVLVSNWDITIRR